MPVQSSKAPKRKPGTSEIIRSGLARGVGGLVAVIIGTGVADDWPLLPKISAFLIAASLSAITATGAEWPWVASAAAPVRTRAEGCDDRLNGGGRPERSGRRGPRRPARGRAAGRRWRVSGAAGRKFVRGTGRGGRLDRGEHQGRAPVGLVPLHPLVPDHGYLALTADPLVVAAYLTEAARCNVSMDYSRFRLRRRPGTCRPRATSAAGNCASSSPHDGPWSSCSPNRPRLPTGRRAPCPASPPRSSAGRG
jgi:hypothetical protein